MIPLSFIKSSPSLQVFDIENDSSSDEKKIKHLIHVVYRKKWSLNLNVPVVAKKLYLVNDIVDIFNRAACLNTSTCIPPHIHNREIPWRGSCRQNFSYLIKPLAHYMYFISTPDKNSACIHSESQTTAFCAIMPIYYNAQVNRLL